MGRQIGRDVVIELMDSVRELKSGFAEHEEKLALLSVRSGLQAEQMRALSTREEETSRRMDAMSKRMDDESKRMDDMSKRMDDMSKRMDDESKRMDDMSKRLDQHAGELAELAGQQEETTVSFLALSQSAGRMRQTTERIIRLLSAHIATTDDRLESLERRVSGLEKTGNDD